MNKKMMLFPILALLLLSVPVAIAGTLHVDGDGTYSQTMEFDGISDTVTLDGDWTFDSEWSSGSRGDIENHVTLYEDSSYHEYAVSPAGGDGLDLLTVVHYGEESIQDVADIQVKGFNFEFDASTNSPYESDKHINILDSYNYYTGGMYGNDQVPDISENRDTVFFQVTDGDYVVGGMTEYMKSYVQYIVVSGYVTLDQTFSDASSDSSLVTSNFYAIHHIVTTAFFGLADGESYDWYGSATMDIKGNNKHDMLYAYFEDYEADFFLKWSSCGTNYDHGNQKGANHPMSLFAFSDDEFTASGNAEDVGSAGWPSGYSKFSGTYEAPTGQWTFTGFNLDRYDGNSVNWLASLNMEP